MHPSAFLLAAQMVMLVLSAIFDESASQRGLLSALSVIVLVLVIWVINRSPAVQWLTWVLAIPACVISLLSAVFNNPNLTAWSSLVEGLLYFYAAGCLIAYMLGDESVTTDELFALAATFTLLAWGFAYLYLVCQTWIPGSVISTVVLDRPLTFLELLSLSFTNLTATGLSDILAVRPITRILVMLEQFVGIGYVAVVVSRLISLISNKKNRKM